MVDDHDDVEPVGDLPGDEDGVPAEEVGGPDPGFPDEGSKRCISMKEDGSPCGQTRFKRPDGQLDPFCIWHSDHPHAAELRREARSKGGKEAAKLRKMEGKTFVSGLEYMDKSDVRTGLRAIARQLELGNISPDKSRALESLVGRLEKLVPEGATGEEDRPTSLTVVRGVQPGSEVVVDGTAKMNVPKPKRHLKDLVSEGEDVDAEELNEDEE